MPVYEYRCKSCGTDFELMRGISRMNDPAICPKCGKSGERQVSVFANSNLGVGMMLPAKPAFRPPPSPPQGPPVA